MPIEREQSLEKIGSISCLSFLAVRVGSIDLDGKISSTRRFWGVAALKSNEG